MPMPPTLPQKWGIPGSEDVRLGRFGSQRLNNPGIHLRHHSILRELNSAVSSGLKPVRTPVAIFGSLGVCIYVPARRHWLISYSSIHLT